MRQGIHTITGCVALIAYGGLTGAALAQDHLLVTEAVTTPTSDEFIEIGNPTEGTIALDNYYLTDTQDYGLLPGQFGAGPAPGNPANSDFVVRFPADASIGPGEVLVIAFDGAGFAGTFGFNADYEILALDPATPDMLEAFTDSIGGGAGLTNSGENATMFFWDQASDLVSDVDMTIIGTPSDGNTIADKTGLSVDGPDADTDASTYLPDGFTMPQQLSDPGFGESTKRLTLETGNEVQAGTGNGITGNDETTEDILVTWDSVYTAPDPGVSLALTPAANITINKVGPVLAQSGSEITYGLTVLNSGTEAAENVTLIDTLPAGLTFVSEMSPPSVTLVDMVEPTIEWSVGTVGAGESVLVELTVAIGAEVSGEIENVAAVSTTTKSDDPKDNSDTQTTNVTMIVDPPDNLVLNEIRLEQPGAENDQYFELKGDPNTNLDGVVYVVIGDDDSGGSGVIEEVVDLSGTSVGADGLYLAADGNTFTLAPPFLIDLSVTLNFEGSDNVTHLLAVNFSGFLGQDLDTDDDGRLDIEPWSDVVDALGLVELDQPPTEGSDFAYGAWLGFVDVGPDGEFLPAHVYRCETAGTWLIGTFDPLDPNEQDTPAETNPDCPKAPDCPGDTNGDNMVNVTDLVNVITTWGSDGMGDGFDADVNDDGTVDVTDLVGVITNWGVCE